VSLANYGNELTYSETRAAEIGSWFCCGAALPIFPAARYLAAKLGNMLGQRVVRGEQAWRRGGMLAKHVDVLAQSTKNGYNLLSMHPFPNSINTVAVPKSPNTNSPIGTDRA